ncbi:uncharacterized protein N7482_002189 [Penicillium canariense]|uniref:Uncharacterized protein n=1 Tax=Penicillium canariense TaxID=189055 RepID=A0A9W9LUW9_9EURO|nr:uncharacterized protein N7482_002189 [Penicillium canariense]KAJ5176312.1 hypothetical protein N7482_002189 [Penicillium canariense]
MSQYIGLGLNRSNSNRFADRSTSTLKGVDRRIKGLEQQINIKDRQLEEQNAELLRRATDLERKHLEIQELSQYAKKWDEFKAFMDTALASTTAIENRTLRSDMDNLHAKYRVLQKRLKQAEDDLQEAHVEQAKAAESLRDVQASAFRFQDQPEWARESDEAIRAKLTNLEREARGWCSRNSVQALSTIRASPAQLETDWQHVMRFDEETFTRNDEHLPRLLLSALLMDYIYSRIFAKPLFFLRWRVAPEEPSSAVAGPGRQLHEPLAGMLDEMTQGNLEGSHAWRAHLLRLLDPNPRSDQPERPFLEATKRRTEEAREKAASQIMHDFLGSSAAFLLNPSPIDGRTLAELQHVFSTAAHLAYKLWLRKSYLSCTSIESIPVYRHDLQLKAHSLHNVQLDANEKALDGVPVRIVTHPGVLVTGNSDGSNYDVCRVWKEPVVWMG